MPSMPQRLGVSSGPTTGASSHARHRGYLILAVALAALVWCAPAQTAATPSSGPAPLKVLAARVPDTSGERRPFPTGTLYTPALLVDFSDYPHQTDASFFDDLVFKDTVGPASVRGYYREVSYGLLDVAPLVLPSAIGWLRVPETREYYLGEGRGYGPYPRNSQKMIEEAIKLADRQVDFRRFDCNGDGFVDNLVIIFAGHVPYWDSPGFAAQKTELMNPVTVDGVKARSYIIVPELKYWPGDMTIGIYVHEMAHSLGLRDLYDGDGSSAGIGKWSLVAHGTYNGPSSSLNLPARPDAWSSARLGWLQPQTLTGPPTLRALPSVGSSRTAAFKLYPGGATSGPEYWLIENRQLTGTDAGLPGSGLLIWHIDERKEIDYVSGPQWDDTHRLVDLEEASGIQNMDYSLGEPEYSAGGDDDPYPGSTNNREFSDLTTPDATTYAGADSRIHIYNISHNGPVMTAVIGFRTPFRPPELATFVDAPLGHPYHVAVEGMAAHDIIVGYETARGTEFRPSSPVLRAQFAKMIDLALGLTVTEGGSLLPFRDVERPADNLYPDDYVAVAYANGLIKGYPGGLFKPYQDISRAQLLTMVVRAVEGVRPGGIQAPPPSWTGLLPGDDPTHGQNISKAEYSGLLWHIDLADFGIWGKATRGEVAQVLWNTMEILGNQ